MLFGRAEAGLLTVEPVVEEALRGDRRVLGAVLIFGGLLCELLFVLILLVVVSVLDLVESAVGDDEEEEDDDDKEGAPFDLGLGDSGEEVDD